MPTALAGVHAKLARAHQHLLTLEQAVLAYVRQRPYRVDVESAGVNSEGNLFRYVARQNPGVPPPHADLSLLVGEALYQLRSSLDHLVHELVIGNGGSALLAGSRHHQFPVFETAQGYEEKAARMIAGVTLGAATRISESQPFTWPGRPRAHPLWLLQDLNNIDKHRFVPLAVVGLDELRGRGSEDDITYAHLFSVTSPQPLHDGLVLFTAAMKQHFAMADVACTVAFDGVGDVGYAPIWPLLTKLYLHVVELVEKFAKTFPD